jgi:hypothetical protein
METGSSHTPGTSLPNQLKNDEIERMNAKRSTMYRFIDGAIGGFISGAIL